MGQEGILLGLVEAVDLVDKQNGLCLMVPPLRFGLVDDGPDFPDAGKHS